MNAIKSPAADAPIANVKQEKCRTRLKVGRVDKESEARRGEASPPARFSDSFYPRSYAGRFRLWRVVKARHLVFRPRRPPRYNMPNVTRRVLRRRGRIISERYSRIIGVRLREQARIALGNDNGEPFAEQPKERKVARVQTGRSGFRGRILLSSWISSNVSRRSRKVSNFSQFLNLARDQRL